MKRMNKSTGMNAKGVILLVFMFVSTIFLMAGQPTSNPSSPETLSESFLMVI